ncbi:MAG: hypothetical protein DI537_38495 [Stutzerimonas stutzeri]|nr:MAG: hypothetical protein DI537_38495 [Stutzerimonas stutzeri]
MLGVRAFESKWIPYANTIPVGLSLSRIHMRSFVDCAGQKGPADVSSSENAPHHRPQPYFRPGSRVRPAARSIRRKLRSCRYGAAVQPRNGRRG